MINVLQKLNIQIYVNQFVYIILFIDLVTYCYKLQMYSCLSFACKSLKLVLSLITLSLFVI